MFGFSMNLGIARDAAKPKFDYTESDHYCERCEVRWRGRADSVCWSCEGRDDAENLTASGKAHIPGKYGEVSPCSSMTARMSQVQEEV